MLVGRLKVSGRIYLGFSVSIALALAVLAFGLVQFRSLREYNRTEAGLAGDTQRLLIASHLLETVRRTETRYRLDADDASLKEHQDAVERIVALLTQSVSSTADPSRRASYRDLLASFTAHNLSFAKLIAVTRATGEANEALDRGGWDVAISTGTLLKTALLAQDSSLLEAAGEIDRLLILARVTNWRFQALYDPKGPAAFRQGSNESGCRHCGDGGRCQ